MSSRLWQCGKYFLLDLSRADFLFPVYYAIKYNTYQATYYWEIISQPCQLARYFLNSFCWSSLYFPHGPDVTAGRMVSASWIWAHSKWSRQHTTYSDSHRHCGRGWLWVILRGWTPEAWLRVYRRHWVLEGRQGCFSVHLSLGWRRETWGLLYHINWKWNYLLVLEL